MFVPSAVAGREFDRPDWRRFKSSSLLLRNRSPFDEVGQIIGRLKPMVIGVAGNSRFGSNMSLPEARRESVDESESFSSFFFQGAAARLESSSVAKTEPHVKWQPLNFFRPATECTLVILL